MLVARIFLWGGGGGGAHLNNRDQIINVGMIHYANSEDTQGRVSNLWSKWNGDDSWWYSVANAEGASL